MLIAALENSCSPLCTIASNTGWVSVSELLMTFSTSDVAVCCSSASVSSAVRACTSSNSRTFSIAITAWSAKVFSKLDLLVGERPHGSVRADARSRRSALPSRSSGRARWRAVAGRRCQLRRLVFGIGRARQAHGRSRLLEHGAARDWSRSIGAIGACACTRRAPVGIVRGRGDVSRSPSRSHTMHAYASAELGRRSRRSRRTPAERRSASG